MASVPDVATESRSTVDNSTPNVSITSILVSDSIKSLPMVKRLSALFHDRNNKAMIKSTAHFLYCMYEISDINCISFLN